ncbi:cell division protein FtsH, partial [Chroococcidiopsis cubana CCALA 043]
MPVEKDGKPNSPNPQHFGSSLLTLLFFLFLFHFFIAPGMRSPTTEVLYSRFRKDVKNGKVAQALLAENQIQYTLKADLPKQQKPQPDNSSTPPPNLQFPQPNSSTSA